MLTLIIVAYGGRLHLHLRRLVAAGGRRADEERRVVAVAVVDRERRRQAADEGGVPRGARDETDRGKHPNNSGYPAL